MVLAVLSLPATISAQQAAYQGDQSDNRSVQQDTLRFTVYGMDCPGCEGGLEKQVNKMASVQYSKADWVNQELLIVVKKDSVLKTSELEQRVKKANFTLKTDADKGQDQK